MMAHCSLTDSELHSGIRKQSIIFGGNKKLRIYGLLRCASGKRMKKENRVFFATEVMAVAAGFRPCGHCMKAQYRFWKLNNLQ